MMQKDQFNRSSGKSSGNKASMDQPSKTRASTPAKDSNAMQRNKMDHAHSTGRLEKDVDQGDPSVDRD